MSGSRKSLVPKKIIKHEQIHIAQQKRYFLIGFILVYLWDYACGRLTGMSHDQAYRNIRFEKEAYGKERELHPLSEE